MLEDFLDKKPLYYDEIDYTRMPRIYAKVAKHFHLPRVIHIIGTNGKGTTGRFLATALFNLGYNTGHYTSPHILHFNERIWYNNENVSMEALEETHEKLLEILEDVDANTLSYFEYTTLLAMLFFSEKTDFIVLEAGLGGEHDATAVFQNDLTLVTPIAKDHEAFLGDKIEAIATTKLEAIRKSAILGDQRYSCVYDIAKKVTDEKNLQLFRVEELLDENDLSLIKSIVKKESLVSYLEDNLALATAALKHFKLNVSQKHFSNARLFGRLTPLHKNILLDVGHNTLAATAILESLTGKKYRLIYNSYKDKNYKEILFILKPIIKEVEIIDITTIRAANERYLEEALEDLKIPYTKFHTIEEDEEYLVFGSFSVVEAFLKVYNG